MRYNTMITDQSVSLLTQLTFLDAHGATCLTEAVTSKFIKSSPDDQAPMSMQRMMNKQYLSMGNTRNECCGLIFVWHRSWRDHRLKQHNENPWAIFELIV